MMRPVAALYVEDVGGCYSGLLAHLLNVDPWPEGRDARRYDGPYPVVAHPPCQRWGPMAVVVQAKFPDRRQGDDGGCFASALSAVRRWGGVLEHPRGSAAWAAHGLAHPSGRGWSVIAPREWTCEVWQSAYGHRAAKPTWLFYAGATPPLELDWSRPPGTHVIGDNDSGRPEIPKKQRSATPIAFRDALLALARNAAPNAEGKDNRENVVAGVAARGWAP